MPRPVTGRRPDSLFDNRYRYDHIYPRGRSGETLRAYDTLQNGLPVVIKRPALQDAPPIRAGQEVNILNEKRALELLSGHPVLTELRHSGTFRVGGQTHHYIVMDMAQGETVESMVIALAEQGKRLPELEMLNILDGLLDLLQAAHDHHMVYNDVDAKHLFWDREHYRLKLIDWGNVVFLESEHAPAHVTRAADILQSGQMIYFILSGGHRLETGSLDPANSLGEDVSPGLKTIINRAVHPEPAQRYPDIAALRHDLAEVRRPIQKNREALVERVRGRLSSASSQTQFEALRADLLEALIVDPGYPPAREMLAEIDTRLKQLAMQGDLDAVRIYIESGNLGRASDLLDEMIARLGDVESPLLLFLQDVCDLLDQQAQSAGTPLLIAEGLAPALDALFRDDSQAAGRALVTTRDLRPAGQLQQFLLAERLTQRMPGVVLLRPHLVRLEEELGHLIAYDRLVQAIRGLINKLDAPVGPGIQPLIRVYQYIADMLVGLDDDLKSASETRGPLGHHPACTLLDIANRARQTADDVVELLEVVAQNVLGDSSRAGKALWRASAIDPINPAFESLNELLNAFHTDLSALREFTPAADGANIANYLAHAQARLEPYQADISDSQFQAVVRGIDLGMSDWEHVMDFVALGGRRPAVDFCRLAAEHVRPLNRATALWFEDTLHRIEEAPHVESLSPNGALGRALADGWDAWDRGRTAEAMLAGKRAADGASTEAEKLAARRLISLGEALDKWLDRGAQTTAAQIEAAERRALALFLPEEESIRQKFSTQMPNMQIYVKAMSKGVVDPLRETSSAGIRVLFFDYVLRGMLALQKEQFDEANTWKDAAGKTLNNARLHPAYQALENAIVTRQLILEAVRVLNSTKNIAGLPEARQAVRAPLATVQLEQAEQALRAVDDALRRWADGDFRAARQLLDTAMERTGMAQNATGKDLGPFKAWLQDLADSAEILAQARRVIDQAALVPADKPEPEVAEALQKLVDLTRRDLGESYTAQLRQWRDTYNSIRDVYLDGTLTKDDKLRLLEGHFASLFIDRQPALPIFRHWQDVIRNTPDPEPEPVRPLEPDVPTFLAGRRDVYHRDAEPLEEDDVAEPVEEYAAVPEPAGAREPRKPRSQPSPLIFVIGGLALILAVIALVIVVSGRGSGENVAPTATSSSGAMLASLPPPSPSKPPPTFTLLPPTRTPVPPSPTLTTSSATPEQLVPSPTHGTPIPTGELISPATLAALPTITPPGEATLGAGPMPGTPVPTNPGIVLPTMLPDALAGDYDVLKALLGLDAKRISWDQDWFAQRDGQWQLGNPTLKPGRAPLIRLGPDILTPLFGADAAQYLKRVDVTLELVNYDQSLLPTGNVYFGAGFESIQGQRAAVEARLVQANVLDLGISLNARFMPKTQLPVTDVKLALAVERNADRTLSLYVNGQLLGASNAAYAPDVPVSIYLYTSTGGVTVNVTSLTIHLEKK